MLKIMNHFLQLQHTTFDDFPPEGLDALDVGHGHLHFFFFFFLVVGRGVFGFLVVGVDVVGRLPVARGVGLGVGIRVVN